VRDPLVFLGVITLLTITPGADMAMVSRSVFMGGRRDAFATTLGIAAGCMIWALASAAGVAAVLAASETAYDALRLAGAAYLVWLGVQSLLAARRGYVDEPAAGSGRRALLDRTVEAFRSSRVRRALDALTGAVLVGLGIRVAAD
jgi:threonine/homoserine/homoserine lactone efflux protein